MRSNRFTAVLTVGLCILGASVLQAEEPETRTQHVPGGNTDKLFEGVLSARKVWPLQGGFAHL